MNFVDIEVVLVTYRSRDHIAELFAQWPAELSVVIVDNSANQDGVKALAASRPRTRYVDGGGQGFARGANLGAMTSAVPYVIFVNPDCRPTADHLAALVEGLRGDPTALSHAATMTGVNGATEMGVGGWEPTFSRVLVYALALHRLLPRAGLFACPPAGRSVQVDWTTGACMAVDMAKFRSVGGFDEMFYVYAEDMALGRRARLAGWRQVLRADVRVPHGAGKSGAPSQEMLKLRGASFANYMLAYHPPLRAHGVLAMISIGYLARGFVAARRHPADVRPYAAFAAGAFTRRASVGGVEVADTRLHEVTIGLRPRRGLRGFFSVHRAV